MDAAVTFERVWKKFRRGERHDSLRDLIPAATARVFRRRPPVSQLHEQEFWALQDVSFSVPQGTALGIIGPNGAGKSTTLKLLTRILKPTQGICRVNGRIGALIEIAAGFHPDLTGRENVFLQGAVMGMKRTEIARQFDAIVDFSGTAAFIDTPVKRYSSGMNARLGFSIAAHLNPDVLIIDEVLSVGDMAFQQRCVARMMDFKRSGATIVFVSHNLQAVDMLCDSCLYLHGKSIALGSPAVVLEQYIRASHALPGSHATQEIALTGEKLTDQDGRPVSVVSPGTPLTLQVQLKWPRTYETYSLSFLVFRSTDNLQVYNASLSADELGVDAREGESVVFDFTFNAHLTRGHYYLACEVWDRTRQACVGSLLPAATFTVDEARTYSGIADIELRATAAGTGASPEAAGTTSAPQGHQQFVAI